ncbi:MAG: D-alanyl-D-alanine carboxypeptidase [Oscillospiraceae bacterium]|nr:D-alanyl-D-alanine carboxypeptidase [Oscillospiraceae bacterium]
MKRFFCFLIVLSVFLLLTVTAFAAPPELVSESAVLIDAETGQVLYDKEMHKQMYPASITKILTVITGLEKLSMTEKMTMSHYAVFSLPVGSSHIALDEGEEITMEQAVYAALLMSANDACNGIAEKAAGSIEAFTEMMNETASRAGAKNSNFVNAHGLSDDNHYTTAYDMAMICRYALKNETFRKVFSTYKYVMSPTNKQPEKRTFVNQHYMVSVPDMKYDGIIGGKAGWTSVSKCTLVTAAERDGRCLIAVVMKCVKDKDKYADTKALLDWGFENFNEVSYNTSDLPSGGYAFENPVELLLPAGKTREDVSLSVTMEDGVDYAVFSYADGEEILRTPCSVSIDVSAKTAGEVRRDTIKGIVGGVVKTVLTIVLCIIGAFVILCTAIIVRKRIYRAKKKKRRRR